jgi:hypothetical protein
MKAQEEYRKCLVDQLRQCLKEIRNNDLKDYYKLYEHEVMDHVKATQVTAGGDLGLHQFRLQQLSKVLPLYELKWKKESLGKDRRASYWIKLFDEMMAESEIGGRDLGEEYRQMLLRSQQPEEHVTSLTVNLP